MLTPTDIKLFEILDEFIDKSLGFWIIYRNWLYYDVAWKDFDFLQEKDNWEIIWHRPTLSTVLRLLYRKTSYIRIGENSISIFKWIWAYSTLLFEYGTTKELKDRSEEKKQELLLFLQSL
jgi:hypothetical protein